MLDTEILKDSKSRINESTWKIWEGVEGACKTQNNVYDEMAARQGAVLDNMTRTEWHSTAVPKWKVPIKDKRGKQCERKSQPVILCIARGRRYQVFNDGNKHHSLAQGGQGWLDPRAVFVGAQN